MIPIVRQMFHTQFFKIITFASQIMFFIFLAKNFGPDRLGLYYIIGTILSVGTYVFGLDLYTYVMRIVPGKTGEEGVRIFKTTVLFELLFIVLTLSAAFLFGGDIFLARLLNVPQDVNLIRLGLLMLIPQLLSMEGARFLFITKRIETANYQDFIKACGWTYLVMLVWLLTKRANLTLLLGLWAVGLSVATIYSIFQIGVKNLVRSPFDRPLIKQGLKFSLPLLLSSISLTLLNASDKWFLSIFHSTKEVGLYSVAFRLGDISYMFTSSIVLSVIWPYTIEAYNRLDLPKTKDYLTKMVKYSFVPLLLLIAVGVNNRMELIQILTRKEYGASASLIPIVILIPVLNVLIYPAHYTNYLKNRTRLISFVNIVGFILNILLNVILVPKFSMYGAATAAVLTYASIAALMYLSVRNELLFDIRDCKLKQLAANFVMTFIVLWQIREALVAYSAGPFVIVLTSALCGALIYFGGLYLFRILDKGEKQIIIDFFKKCCNPVFNGRLHPRKV